MEHRLSITGMTCGGCSGRLTRVLESTTGVNSVVVELNPGSAVINTSDEVTTAQLIEVVEGTGFAAIPQ
jgi:copper chaperone CopZ